MSKIGGSARERVTGQSLAASEDQGAPEAEAASAGGGYFARAPRALTHAVVRPVSKGQEVLGVCDVLLALRAHAVGVKALRVGEALQGAGRRARTQESCWTQTKGCGRGSNRLRLPDCCRKQ
jgi:hypothetical protein